MKIIISPAKKMVTDMESLPVESIPVFIDQAARLMEVMRSLSYEEAKAVWKCSDKIAGENYSRFQHMDLKRSLTPAILAYEGIQYQYMAPVVMERSALDYLRDHLRILSGFYGLLRPFDGVVSYRLEMQAKLPQGDLYGFWKDKIAEELCRGETEILNLASKEYSRCISRPLPAHVRMTDVIFGDPDGRGGVREKGTYAKMARGEMVNFMAGRRIERLEEIVEFRRLNYHFSEELSSEYRYVFLRGPQ